MKRGVARERRHSVDRRRGNALIEFALSFALLFPLFTGAFQFGYAYHVYNKLEIAMRGAARYASLRTYDSATATPSAGYALAVANSAVYGDPAGGSVPVAPGLTTSNVQITVILDKGVPRNVRVALTGYRLDALFATINLNGKPGVSFPYCGNFAP